jgi:hypothetical protein
VSRSSFPELAPAASNFSRGALLQRLFKFCYLSLVIVSMVGWLSAFGWLTVKVVKWLMV